MDAKSKADFINSVAAGSMILCPQCGATNKPNCKFCTSCGAKIAVSAEKPMMPLPECMFEVKEDTPLLKVGLNSQSEVQSKIKKEKAPDYVEPNNAFASGLPEWTVEPPQIVVRRR